MIRFKRGSEEFMIPTKPEEITEKDTLISGKIIDIIRTKLLWLGYSNKNAIVSYEPIRDFEVVTVLIDSPLRDNKEYFSVVWGNEIDHNFNSKNSNPFVYIGGKNPSFERLYKWMDWFIGGSYNLTNPAWREYPPDLVDKPAIHKGMMPPSY